MKARLRQMERIVAVRSLQERMREAACARSSAKAQETGRAVAQMIEAKRDATHACCTALHEGDRAEWALAEAIRELADWNRTQLAKLLKRQEADLSMKQNELADSRMERERCARLEERLHTAIDLHEQRREQARSDDRFAARRHWAASINAR